MHRLRTILLLVLLLSGSAAFAANNEAQLTGRIEISDSQFGRPYADHSGTPAMVRAPELVGNGGNSYYAWNYDPALFPNDRASTFVVFAGLEVGVDGVPVTCQATKVSRTIKEEITELALTSEPARVACDLVKDRVRFRHAIDRAGMPMMASTKLRVLFNPSWQVLPVPAMPPVSDREKRRRSLRNMMPGEVLPREGNWPPGQIGAPGASLVVPDWRDHVPPDRKLPAKASVGLILSIENGGRVSECRVLKPSGLDWLDQASCAALSSVQHRTGRWPVPYFPVEIIWRGDSAQFRQPRFSQPPELIAEVPLTGPLLLAAKGEPPFDIDLLAFVNSEGKMERCLVRGSSGDDKLDALACAAVQKNAGFTAPTDVFGDPSPGQVAVYADWQRAVLTNLPLERENSASPSR